MRVLLNDRYNPLLFLFITSYALLNAQPITRVQFVHTYTYPGNAVTFPTNNSAGNAIVVMASWYAAPGTPTISDTRGNTYTMLPALTGGGAGTGEQTSILIWYALNIGAGANTVTISGAGIDVGITAVEYSGVATSGAIGITSTLPYFGGTPTTTPTSSSFTPSAGSLLFVAFADETNPQNSIAAGSGYTLIQGDGNHVDIEEDNVNSSAGSQTASITVSFATWSWAMYVVEFLPASGSSPPPLGTVLWTNTGDGSGFSSIVPAVPSANGVADIFGLQNDGTVAAITSDGTTAWTFAASSGSQPWNFVSVLPDFQGGLVVVNDLGSGGFGSITKIDGITGQAYPSFNPNGNGIYRKAVAMDLDGTIFAAEALFYPPIPPPFAQATQVVGIDPTTGAQKFSTPPLEPQPSFSTVNYRSGCATNSTIFMKADVFGMIVAGDGNAYLPYGYLEFSCSPGEFTAYHMRLLQTNSSGAYNIIAVADSPSPSPGMDAANASMNAITSADTGVVVTWSTSWTGGGTPAPQTYGMAITSGTSVSVVNAPTVPGQYGNTVPVLQREDGSFVGTAEITPDGSNPQYDMVAFNSSGAILWTVPNESPVIAIYNDGVVDQSGTTYDQNGNVTGLIANLPIYSWLGNAYEYGSLVSQVAENPLYFELSFWPFQGAMQRRGSASVRIDSKANSRVRGILTSGFWQKFQRSHCNAVIGNSQGLPIMVANYSFSAVQNQQNLDNFYDVTDSSGGTSVGNFTLKEVTGGTINNPVTLSDYLTNAGATAATPLFAQPGPIVLSGSVLAGSGPEFVLVHELLFHSYAGQSDNAAFGNTYFTAQGLWRPSGSTASVNISTWLSTDCTCTPGNPANPPSPPCTANTAKW